jgi:hypothetical protein
VGGATQHISGLVANPFGPPDGTLTFFGAAASAAFRAFNNQEGGFDRQLGAAIYAGFMASLSQIDGGRPLFSFVENFSPQIDRQMRRARAKRAEKDGGERLSDCVQRYLSKFFSPSLLRSITWTRNGIPSYVPLKAEAFTLGHHIYFDPEYFTDGDISDEEMVLIAHETTHVRQNQQNGTVRQSVSYLLEAIRTGTYFVQAGPFGLYHIFFSAETQEEANKFEQEARAQAEKIREDIQKNGNPCKKKK